ncbi:MAG: PDDEXK nuclease domain-containing protein [Candidatus Ratteibacteria bacterium]
MDNRFLEILSLIQAARNSAYKAVNKELINLYWNVGAYLSEKLASAQWGDKTIDELANFIQKEYPELKGFNRRGLYRMRQFYETYNHEEIVTSARTQLQIPENKENTIVSLPMTQFQRWDIRNTPLAQISWTQHLILMSRCKSEDERLFYLYLTQKENYTVKELERQINASVFERTMLSDKIQYPKNFSKTSNIKPYFKDLYIFEFLNIPEPFTENELQKALIKKLKIFLLELGKDFLFVGEEYRLQVGNKDFFIDLLFYHRQLQCLVAFELKTVDFSPEHLGQLNFYLEALDRDVKKPHENPSIGILLCKGKDNEVVEYALSRNLSPALVSQYQTILPDKKILQAKLHELAEQWENQKKEEL